MMRKQSKYEWPDDLRKYIVKQLGAYRSNSAIYQEITSPDFERKHLIKGLDPDEQNFRAFSTKARNIPAIEIEAAHRMWLTDWQGVPFATSKGRVQALHEMIGILRSIKEDRGKYSDADLDITITEIVNHIRKLLRDIRGEMDAEAEREAKAASGTNIYIGRSMTGSEITPELLNDTFIALFAEFGLKVLGLHHWEIEQLEKLEAAVQKEIASKRTRLEAHFEIIEEDNKDRTDRDQ
jgi:hypothetical protein